LSIYHCVWWVTWDRTLLYVAFLLDPIFESNNSRKYDALDLACTAPFVFSIAQIIGGDKFRKSCL